MKRIDMLRTDFMTNLDYYTLKNVNIDKSYIYVMERGNESDDKAVFDSGEVVFELVDEFNTASVKVIFTIGGRSLYNLVTLEFNFQVDAVDKPKKKKKALVNKNDVPMSLTDRVVLKKYDSVSLYKRLCYGHVQDAKLASMLLKYI